MDSTTRDRIGVLSRHLIRLVHLNPNNLLSPLLLSAEQGGGSMPVVIGGMVLDVLATPLAASNAKSTSPGKVDFMLGGVARNIAECMAKFGTKAYLVSTVGDDMAGDLLMTSWKSASLHVEGIHHGKHIKTATVCCMFDVNGELASGVARVDSIEKFLTPEWIEQSRSIISRAPMLMIDANLSPQALETSCKIAAEYNIPVWFEPVSVAKSRRIASIAKHIRFTSPNEHELIAMANVLSDQSPFAPIEQNILNGSPDSLFQYLKPAILALLDAGIKFVLITLGPSGALLCCRIQQAEDLFSTGVHNLRKGLNGHVSTMCPWNHHWRQYKLCTARADIFAMHFPALSSLVVRVSGAGDCLVGAIISSMCSGLNVVQSVAVGIAAAKVAVEVETNVPQKFDLGLIADDASSVYFKAKVVSCGPEL